MSTQPVASDTWEATNPECLPKTLIKATPYSYDWLSTNPASTALAVS